jgi:hypothetical protein
VVAAASNDLLTLVGYYVTDDGVKHGFIAPAHHVG